MKFLRPLLGLAGLLLLGAVPAQTTSFREDFIHQGNFGWWGTNPGNTPTTTELQGWVSPNKHWNKVLWDWTWPGGTRSCRLLPERVAVDTNNQLLLSVPRIAYGSPYNTPGSGGEVVSTRQSHYGAYRVHMSVSTVTTDFNTGACNSFIVKVQKEAEIEICLYSRVQGVIGIGRGVAECILRKLDKNNQVTATMRRSVMLGFDPKLAKHTYGFDWKKGSVEFFIDNQPVPGSKVTATEFTIPSSPGNIRIKHWTGDPKGCGIAPRHWQNQNQSDLYMVVDWVSYTYAASFVQAGQEIPQPNPGRTPVLAFGSEKARSQERRHHALA